MKVKVKVSVLTVLLAILPVALAAQGEAGRGGFEVNGAMALSTRFPGDVINNIGAGGEALFHYRLTRHLGLYGTGYIIGLQYKRPMESSNVSVFVRGGFQYKHIEIEDPSGELLFDTTHGPGWQVGFGLDLPVSVKWSVIPELKFSTLTENGSSHTFESVPDRSYFSVRIGILKKF